MRQASGLKSGLKRISQEGKEELRKYYATMPGETRPEKNLRQWNMACKHGLFTQKRRDIMKASIDTEQKRIKKIKEIQETSPPLPEGWTISMNGNASRAIYYHPETKKVQYERPKTIVQLPTTIQVGTRKNNFTDEKLNCIKLRLAIEILKQKIEKEQQNYVEWCEKNTEHEYVRLEELADKAEEMANHKNEIRLKINKAMARENHHRHFVTKEHCLKILKTKKIKEFAIRKRSRSDRVKKLQSELVSIKKQLDCAENLSV